MKLRRKDKKSSIFSACFGILAVITGYQFGLGTLTSPGPGFLPFAGGLVTILLSVIIYVQALGGEGEKDLFQIGNAKILLSLICFVLYAIFFKRLGFILANFILLTILFQLLQRKSWIGSVLTSAVTIFAAYLIFIVWLKVQLPKGFIGF